jgi:hypothetical protein
MGIDPMNKISIIIRILFAVTLFQQMKDVWAHNLLECARFTIENITIFTQPKAKASLREP